MRRFKNILFSPLGKHENSLAVRNIATLGTIYNLGGEVDEESQSLVDKMRRASWEDGPNAVMITSSSTIAPNPQEITSRNDKLNTSMDLRVRFMANPWSGSEMNRLNQPLTARRERLRGDPPRWETKWY